MGKKGLGGALLLALACARAPAPLPAPTPPPAPPGPPAPPPCERIVAMEIRKSERVLVAHCARGAVLVMTVALGREPEGAKQQRGDLRTPEGLYHVAGPARRSARFHRFIPLDYPSLADAEAARQEGRIGERDYRRILAAHARGEPPPRDTPLGGDIGFHGEGRRWRGDSADLDWTYGCFALRDEEIELLAERLAPGVPVEIRP